MKAEQINIRKDKLKDYIYVGILQTLFFIICFITLKSFITIYKLKTKKCSCCGSEYDIRFAHCPGCGLSVSENKLSAEESLQAQITEDIRIYKKSQKEDQKEFLKDDQIEIYETDFIDADSKDAITSFISEKSVETDFFREMED